MHRSRSSRLFRAVVGVTLAVVGASAGALAAESVPGFVDGTRLAQLAGDDAVSVEITLGKTLLAPLLRADPDLEALGAGLESIYALVLEIDSPAVADRVIGEIREIERRLMAQNWQRLVRVKERDEEVKVLVLVEGDEIFAGLVVTVIEKGSSGAEVVFANIAGRLDLAAIERLGQRLDLPGLEELDLEDLKSGAGAER